MRLLCFLFLAAVGVLAYQNQQDVDLTVFNQAFTVNVPALIGLTYLAGMLSGWTVVGMLRRSFHRVTQGPLPGEHAQAR
jgi:hypothetical protein